MLDLFVDPESFFADEAEDPDLVVAAVIVVLTGLVTSVGGLLVTRKGMSAFSSGVGGASQFVSLLGAGFGVVVVVVLWVVFTGVFYGAASLLEGEGEFVETLALTGWGHVPIFVSGVVGIVTTYLALQGIPAPTDPQGVQAFNQAFQGHRLVQLNSYTGLAFTLWQGALWLFAVEQSLGLDRKEAALAVGGPVLVVVAVQAAGLFLL